MMDLLFPFALVQIEKFPIRWLLVDPVPVIRASFAWPLLDRLHLGPGLLVPEHFHQFVVQLNVDIGILFPATKALMRPSEEIEMKTRQLAPIVYTSGIGIIFGDLLEDLLMHAHRFGVGTNGGVEFRA